MPLKHQYRPIASLLITGASGFIGRSLIEALKEHYMIYAIARRSQRVADVPDHHNIRWFLADIGDLESFNRVIENIARETEIDFVFHLAGYYDFTLKPSPEYDRTNIGGTLNVLEAVRKLNIKRFIFSSSLTVTEFSREKVILTERSPADADNPYSRSKRIAEQLVENYSQFFPCTTVRLAAIFSDWCEYGPLYALLNMWCSQNWRQRIIVGRGETALPYLHINDLNRFWKKLIEEHNQLNRYQILVASPNGSVSHREIFDNVFNFYRGENVTPINVSKVIAYPGLVLLNVFKKALGKKVFERPWMLRFVDTRMVVDSSFTQQLLGWNPRFRYHLTRRLLYLIENMKRNPLIWEQKNLAMAHKAIVERPGLKLYNALLDAKAEIINEQIRFLSDPDTASEMPYYHSFNARTLRDQVEFLFNMWESVILNGDRLHILNYVSYLVKEWFKLGISINELSNALQHMAYLIETALRNHELIQDLQHRIYTDIVLTMQLILDEIEETQELLIEEFHANLGEYLHDSEKADNRDPFLEAQD